MSEPAIMLQPSPAFPVAAGPFGASGRNGVALTVLAPRAMATMSALKGRDEDVKAGIRRSHGLDLPQTPRAVRGERATFVWTGPGQWLVLGPVLSAPGDGPAFAEALAAETAGAAAVTDQSDSRILFRIEGPQARATLAKGLSVDLDAAAFRHGDAAATTCIHIAVQLWQSAEAGPAFDLAVGRSFSADFWRWLTESAAEFGAGLRHEAI